MVRYLLLLLGAVFLRMLWRGARAMLLNRAQSPSVGGGTAAPPGADFRGAVVRCERCDLHVPEGKALTADGRTYCSDTCRDAVAAAEV